MMRYSEISRDLSSDSLKFVEPHGEEYIYKNLRDESPPSDISTHSGPLLSKSCHHQNQIGGSYIANNRLSYGSSTTPRPRKDKSLPPPSSKDREFERIPSKTINSKGSRRKSSIGSACLNAMSTSPSSGCYYCYGSTPPGKTQSLPLNSSIKNYDSVILSALRVSAEELANQITLLDFPVFAGIQPDELTSCAWTKKDKHIVTPNIVAFTKRFNHTSFWTVQEILSGDLPKQRAEILTHFIKVAKKLYELNNLHSLFAIISAMQSASIYRLKKTWSCLSKKDKQTFDRLADVFSEQKNWANLREYLESLRLPCIPYLGLFLTDLIYIDLAHPHSGGLEPEQRRNKMNNILRVISNYQQSDYTNLVPIESSRKYLQSIRYIEELQNIFEEDQYKKSLNLEPSSSGPSSSSCSSKESFNVDAAAPALACLNLSPAKTMGSVRIANGAKFIPGHRKCRSLGSKFRSTSLPRNFYQKCNCPIMMIAPGIGTISNKRCKCRIFGKISNGHIDGTTNHLTPDPNADHSVLSQPRHLLDDSVLEDGSFAVASAAETTSTESSEGVCHRDPADVSELCSESLSFQGCVRRKTVLKEGRKPAVASWQRYWLQIWASSLVYFPPKSFKGCERSDFKREPCKVCPLDGWCAQVLDNPKHKNSFELFNPAHGTVYRFRTDSPQATHQWTNSICKAAQRNADKPLPTNLMSFE
ncbi:ras-specific guanine nucleotide-releasing factor RalGPS1 isoform X2 [Episyrphus balteatus]|uniref:ras-specific guanine nucleotide-releasing factor RalGPS1 isoform X2 n=1 Tax=Episyrphus balteatus TaxID=286459 RepID=UPI002486AB02|nr:ras-specific guanine nucleotide-releasing factor RalGPS1 isoform X2 [Episyrphus balteatus]